MENLHEHSARRFSRVVREVIGPVYDRVSSFVAQWNYQSSSPQAQPGMHSFKFALTEDGYVLILFRLTGIDQLECSYECWLPGAGCKGGHTLSGSLSGAEEPWVESCFQAALDDFVVRFSGAHQKSETPEAALA
jgi:hypothetical protein